MFMVVIYGQSDGKERYQLLHVLDGIWFRGVMDASWRPWNGDRVR